jgi:uncharacterized membrane protein
MKNLSWHSIITSRPYLLSAILFGAIVAFLLQDRFALMTRALIAWNAGVVLVVLLVAAVFSLSAIFFELSALADAKGGERAGRYTLTVLTLFGSWLLVGVLFCFHYAHMYYRCHAKQLPLKFPDDEKEPDYWDFLYFSFTISVAVQTSDISIMTRSMRKLVLGHSVLNFFFNLVILGLSINIAAGLIK